MSTSKPIDRLWFSSKIRVRPTSQNQPWWWSPFYMLQVQVHTIAYICMGRICSTFSIFLLLSIQKTLLKLNAVAKLFHMLSHVCNSTSDILNRSRTLPMIINWKGLGHFVSGQHGFGHKKYFTKLQGWCLFLPEKMPINQSHWMHCLHRWCLNNIFKRKTRCFGISTPENCHCP